MPADGLSIVIPTHNRAARLRDTLMALADQMEHADPNAFEVVVVLDGCSDNSRAVVESTSLQVPLRWIEQPHSGLAAARNAGVHAAGHTLVLFLDDDVVPEPGTVERHRRAHMRGDERVVVGPYPLAQTAKSMRRQAEWWRSRYTALADSPSALTPDDVTFANTSVPAGVLKRLGGFDARFRGWGYEDVEMGYRILAAGIPVVFDPEAVAWHHQDVDVRSAFRRAREEGRNLSLLLRMHPDAEVFRSMAPRAAKRGRRVTDSRPGRLLLELASHAGLGCAVVAKAVNPGIAERVLGVALRIQRRLGTTDVEVGDGRGSLG